MKIKEITSESGNDFSAWLVCEHCSAEQLITTGYHDNYYHTQVMPSLHCDNCGLDRRGDSLPIPESTPVI